MMYCGDERLSKIAEGYHSDLASFCSTEWSMARLDVDQSNNNGMEVTSGDSERHGGAIGGKYAKMGRVIMVQ